jgi:cell wall-associated NlpC family hydrolase
MLARNLLIVGGFFFTCTGCHLVQPIFTKPATTPATKSGAAASNAPSSTNVPSRSPSGKGTPLPVKTIQVNQSSTAQAPIYKNEGMAPAGLRPADHLYVLQETPALLQVKYAILLDVVAEKLTNASLLDVMDSWWGTRYCLGGSTDNCIDCSAFVQVIYRDVYGIALPRTSSEQYGVSELIDREELKEGDLVFFHTRGRRNAITHVGVYLQNNKFVHASTSNGVSISDLDETYWKPRFRGGGRLNSQR